MKYLSIVLLLIVMVVQADVYRSIDNTGNVIFSDQQGANTEQIELKKLPTYVPGPIPEMIELNKSEAILDDLAPPKYQISIISPQQNESLWENTGNVTVRVNVIPKLSVGRFDRLIFKLDGRQMGEPQSSTGYLLEQLDRGSHIVGVSVVDKAGKVLSISESVLFHLHRH